MPVVYRWSGWRLSQTNNGIPAWWSAHINGRNFVSMVAARGDGSVGEYNRGQHFVTTNCLTLEDFYDRSSSYLIGPPNEADLNEVFAAERKLAADRLEKFMTVAWLEIAKIQGESILHLPGDWDANRYVTYGTSTRLPTKLVHMTEIAEWPGVLGKPIEPLNMDEFLSRVPKPVK